MSVAPATPVTYATAPAASHFVLPPPAGSMVAPAQGGYFQWCRPAGAPAPALAAPMPVYSQQHMPITSMARATTPVVTMPSMVTAPSMVVAPMVSMTQPVVQAPVSSAAAAPAATAKKAKKSKKAAKKNMCC
eukprot:TRINITY_DN1769_c0_g1_i1.p1 TRINITY_DN1769_c0_g1~~TRINITY_DN1769_c0_g1_i1.p1  ORF type:complete len:155 (-),score=36.65 TRINITY_DN1769_c0_g1_i1:119-514(-)